MAKFIPSFLRVTAGGGCSLKLKSKFLLLCLVGALAGAHNLRAQGFGLAPNENLQQRREKPITLTGRQFVYDKKTDTFIAKGNAELNQITSVLSGDELEYQRTNRKAMAVGNVHLSDPEIELSASKAEVEVDDETAELDDAKVNLKGRSYYLAGRKIRKLLGQHYKVDHGVFTTCGCESGVPSWTVSGRKLDVHMGDSGTVEGARFNILNHPILYLPYAVFPADSERKSGLLSPRLGQSRVRGFQYTQPYFIDINRSSDATLALDVETSARVGMLAEYRIRNGTDDYLEVTGAFLNENIRENPESDIVDKFIADPHIPKNRYGLIGLVRQHITPDLVVYGDGDTVSDSLYLREMNIYTLSHGYGSNFNVLRAATSDFGAQQSFTNSFARLDGVWNQDLIQLQPFALQTLPELLFSGRQQFFHGLLYSDYDVQAVNFWRDAGVRGDRLDFNPRLVLPWRLKNYLTGYFQAGGRETLYDTSGHDLVVIPVGTGIQQQNNNSLALDGLTVGGFDHRELVYAGGGISTVLEKIYNLHVFSLRHFKHTIEPVVDYSYVPRVEQRELPIFDEVDRVNARSLVTYGLVSRLFAKSGSVAERPAEKPEEPTSPENLEVTPAPNYRASGASFELARFTLLEAYDTAHSVTKQGSRLTDIDAGLTLFPTSVLALTSMAGYDPHANQLDQASVVMSLRPPWKYSSQASNRGRALQGGPFLQVSYTFIGGREAVQQITGRMYYEFFDRFGLYYEPSYSLADRRLLYSEYGIRVKSKCDCWIIDIGVTDKVNPREVQTLFQVTLGGIGSAGRNPFGRNPFSQPPTYY